MTETAGTTTEPEIFISVQRWVNGDQILTRRKLDLPTYMRTKIGGSRLIEVEVDAMLEEVGYGR